MINRAKDRILIKKLNTSKANDICLERKVDEPTLNDLVVSLPLNVFGNGPENMHTQIYQTLKIVIISYKYYA